MKNMKVTKNALCLSIILLIVWFVLGTTSSISWFREEDELVNTLHFGEIDIEMYHKVGSQYKEITETTKVFSDNALYEPGYIQVAYLKIENNGTIPFTYDLSVVPDLSSMVIGTSVLGSKIILPNYLKFGLYIGETEDDVIEKTSSRIGAKSIATRQLSHFSQSGGTMEPGETQYAAVVIYMPEDVGNEANYRGDAIPGISLGLSAVANQIAN